jgi:hypothetical protein
VALLPTLLAIAVGVGLGLRWGGRIAHVLEWRPVLPLALAAGLAALALADLAGLRGAPGATLSILGMASLLAFAVVNIRTGGMVLVVAGLGLDLLVTLLNFGTPVSGSALVSSGLVDRGELDDVVLTGGRTLADGAVLAFLGDVIPLPWGQVISIGDLLTLAGIALVTASLLRRFEVGGPRRVGGHGAGAARTDYRTALDALGRGPAPRRGPGLHPSRLDERRRRRPGPGARQPNRRRPGSPPR